MSSRLRAIFDVALTSYIPTPIPRESYERIAGKRDVAAAGIDDNDEVLEAPAWQQRRVTRRVRAPVTGRVLAAIALALIAVTESAARSAATGVSVQRALVLVVVAAATTTPVAFPAGAG